MELDMAADSLDPINSKLVSPQNLCYCNLLKVYTKTTIHATLFAVSFRFHRHCKSGETQDLPTGTNLCIYINKIPHKDIC